MINYKNINSQLSHISVLFVSKKNIQSFFFGYKWMNK